MPRKPEKPSDSPEARTADHFHARLTREENEEWVRCCPNCFSTNIVPFRVAGATWVAGVADHGAWICQNCGYHGAAIEANRSDLAEFLSHRRVCLSPEEKKASYLDNRKPSRRDTGL